MDQELISLFEEKLRESGLVSLRWKILQFAANCLLVLHGTRLSYLTFSADQTESVMFEAVLAHYSSLEGLRIGANRSLLVLRENADGVVSMFREAGSSHPALAKVLGYHYQGRGWSRGDRYNITYYLRCNREVSHLYSFMVPVACYDDECRERIADDVKRFNASLARYGFEVHSACKLSLSS